MYIEGEVKMTFFVNEKKENTAKTLFATLSDSTKVGEENGKGKYENDYWDARFVGGCMEKSKELKDKDKIILTKFNIRKPYNKELKREFPQITVFDFKIADRPE